jgi:hypothetical protein
MIAWVIVLGMEAYDMANTNSGTVGTATRIYTFTCADCNRVTASYREGDSADYERANRESWQHSCKEQRAANRKAAKRMAVR